MTVRLFIGTDLQEEMSEQEMWNAATVQGRLRGTVVQSLLVYEICRVVSCLAGLYSFSFAVPSV